MNKLPYIVYVCVLILFCFALGELICIHWESM
jgi:hypothetical protein